MTQRCPHDIRVDLCCICSPQCWVCHEPVEGKTHVTLLDGSVLCGKCHELVKELERKERVLL